MIEIKEGIDLDRAIAGVIGLICTQRVLGSDIEFYVDPRAGTNAVPRTFKPSVDLNDAFQAAEMSFRDYTIKKLGTDKYEFECYFKGDDGRSRCGEYASPCLAICAAIMKLEELKQT
jgi:hypothetical protein